MIRTAGSILGILCAAALGACMHEPATSAQAPAQAQTQAVAAACPIAELQGVHATVADIHDGVAITFTSADTELDQLRQNVHAMADSNDKQGDAFAACPCGRTTVGAAEAMPGAAPAEMTKGAMPYMPAAEAKVDEIPTGAVLKLTSKDHAQMQALRSAVRDDIRALRTGCLHEGKAPKGGF